MGIKLGVLYNGDSRPFVLCIHGSRSCLLSSFYGLTQRKVVPAREEPLPGPCCCCCSPNPHKTTPPNASSPLLLRPIPTLFPPSFPSPLTLTVPLVLSPTAAQLHSLIYPFSHSRYSSNLVNPLPQCVRSYVFPLPFPSLLTTGRVLFFSSLEPLKSNKPHSFRQRRIANLFLFA